MIYFVQDSGTLHIKIGYSVNAESRVNGLQTGCPSMLSILQTMPGERSLEAALHDRFAAYRVHGEWFKPATAIIEYMLQQKANVPAVVAQSKSPWPLKIYLAGKITKNCWRNSIVNGIGIIEENDTCDPSGHLPVWEPMERSIFKEHTYVGPFFSSCDHGCSHGDDDHGVNASYSSPHYAQADDDIDRRDSVVTRCLQAIHCADVFFAWIDSLDCYGTITEIGYAKALGKKLWICGPKEFRDMWFPYRLSEWTPRFVVSHDPKNALQMALIELKQFREKGF